MLSKKHYCASYHPRVWWTVRKFRSR